MHLKDFKDFFVLSEKGFIKMVYQNIHIHVCSCFNFEFNKLFLEKICVNAKYFSGQNHFVLAFEVEPW